MNPTGAEHLEPATGRSHVMHAITPIALTELILGAVCAVFFGYCVYLFVSIVLRPAHSKRRKS